MTMAIEEFANKGAEAALEKDIRKLQEQYGGLLSRAAALKILSKQRGTTTSAQPTTAKPSLLKPVASFSEARLNDVISFEAIVARVFAPKTFEKAGRKGKVQNVELKDVEDNSALLVLWNKDVDALESNAVERGCTARVQNGLVKTTTPALEIHSLLRTQIAWQPAEKPLTDRLKTLPEIMENDQDVDAYAVVARKFEARAFARPEGKPAGTVMRALLQDGSGQRALVSWDGNAETLSKVPEGGTLKIEGGYAKRNQAGDLELHVGWRGHVVINPRGYEAPETTSIATAIKPLAAVRENETATVRVKLDKLLGGRIIRKCGNCGNNLRDGEASCSNCGNATERKLLMITAGFSDESASMRAVLFDEAAMALIGLKHLDVELDTLLELKREYLVGKTFTLLAKTRPNLAGNLELNIKRVLGSE